VTVASLYRTLGLGRRIALAVAVAAAVSVAWLLLLSPSDSGARQGIGDHSFTGTWSFGAEGALEQDGEPGRGFWEIGRFTVDGEGHMTGGVEYSDLLGTDDSVVDQPFTFEGTYTVHPDATGKATVDVTLPNGVVIQKTVWFVLNDIRKGEAHGMLGGHLHAELGEHLHGRAGLHEAQRIQ